MPILRVTDEIVKKMAAEAINSSKAVGLGWMHFDKSQTITADDIHIVDGRISLDYVGGRMVKFYARKQKDGDWQFPDGVSPDYQSWCVKYPTYELLRDAMSV